MIEPNKIIRSNRKTLALTINKEGELIVKAPAFMTRQQIMQFVMERQEWIRKKTEQIKKQALENKKIEVADGEEILFMGKKCTIRRKIISKVYFDGETFKVPDRQDAKDLLIAWYKKKAKEVFWNDVVKYARSMNLAPSGIRITSAKTRWGSCSCDNHLNFSFRLLMCPKEIIEYVVVHELCHILHRDHSKAFWKSVEEVDHSYKEHEKWLKEHAGLMEVI